MTLMQLLPGYYRNSDEVIELQNAFNKQTNDIINSKNTMFEQLDLHTATWGLSYWEKAYGLDVDISKSYEFRRERIKSKMRGQGTTTALMMKNVAESFSNGEVEVIEDNENYTFIIKFIGTLGIPANMADLIITINEIKPAHLAYTFEYNYRTQQQLNAYTHQQLNGYTHQQLREGEID